MSYGTPLKNTHRAVVLELANADPDHSILYLDDDTAGATIFFREHGVSTKRLAPVNYSRDACTDITRITKVSAICGDMNEVVVSRHENGDRYSFVWLDLQCRTITRETLTASLGMAPYVGLTLSTRGVPSATVIKDALRIIRLSGGVCPEDPTRYRGKNGITNVVRFLIMAKSKPTSVAKSCTTLTLPQPRTKPLTKTVDLPSPPTPTADAFVGTVLYIPTSEWTNKKELATWSTDIKEKRGKLCFRVVGTHYHKKLALRAIMKNNRMNTTKEHWTLTPTMADKYRIV